MLRYRGMTEPLLSLRHLVTAFETDEGYVRAVDDVSFDVLPGRTLGIVGESGCGKSVTSLSIMRLIPSPPGFIEGGEALFVKVDVSSPESTQAMAATVTDAFGGIDFLVNNAAIFGNMKLDSMIGVDWDYYKKFMDVNMNGALLCVRACYRSMRERGGGSIVNQSSTAAWMAAGFEQALDEDAFAPGEEVLTLGYGSGDAAEVIPFFMADGWREAAAAIGFGDVMQLSIDLDEERYIALHDGRKVKGLDYIPRNEFVIDRIGRADERHFSDLGIEYYRYVG